MVGYDKVSVGTIREDVFNNLATLINANKLPGWTVLASFPETKPVFPCIIINPAFVNFKNLSLTRSKQKFTIKVEIEFFSESKFGKEKIDQALDNLQATFINNYTTLKTYGLVLDMANPFSTSSIDTDIFNDNKLNTASIEVNLRLV